MWFGGTGVSSEEPKVFGCTDPNALNYDSLATAEDGSCTYPPPTIILCGTEYASEKAAYDALKYEPQSQLCDKGIKFRSSYIDEE